MPIDTIALGNYRVSIDTTTGAIKGLWRDDSPQLAGHVDPVVTLAADIAWKGIDKAPEYISHEVEPEGTLRIDVRLGPLTLHDRLTPANGLLERRVVIENTSQGEVQLTGVRMALGGISIGDPAACRFEAPANTVRPRVPLSVAASQPVKPLMLAPQYPYPPEEAFAPAGRAFYNQAFPDAPDVGPGLLIVHNPQAAWSLAAWYVSDIEAGTPWVTGDGTHATLGFDVWVAGYMPVGATLQAATMYIVAHAGNYASVLDAYRGYMTHTGIMPPIYGRIDNATDWTGVFEVHPGMYGGFGGFSDYLPKIAAMGFDTIYMLPVMEHENQIGQPWDGNWDAIGSPYAMHDFSKLEPSLGGEHRFQEMVDTAHDLGMRVLMDFVAQGSSIDSPYVKEHPQWYARNEKGEMVHSHGWTDTWSLDWANPDYHAYMLDWTIRYARDHKIDGYRVDAPHGKEPNWDRMIPYHASYTNLGATRMLEDLRRRLMALRPNTAMYCELFGPLWIRSHDISNDYLPYAMGYEMFHGTLSPHDFNEYLRDYWAIMPHAEDGSPSPRICFTETHDTRSWLPVAMRGSAFSRVMLAILVTAGFVPMIWSGQEKGQEDFIKGLLLARRQNAALRRGTFLFNEVAIDRTVQYPRNHGLPPQDLLYTLIRHDEKTVIWALASMFPSKVTLRVGLPLDKLPQIDPDKRYRLRDLITYQFFHEYGKDSWTGAELGKMQITPEMVQPYIFRIEEVPAPTSKEDNASA